MPMSLFRLSMLRAARHAPSWRAKVSVRGLATVKSDEKYPIGTSLEYATGKELSELQAEEAGDMLFNRDPIRGPFGTKQAPAIVPSGKHARIVGCVGPPDEEHMPLYFELTDGPMQKCLECGQVFKLKYEDLGDGDHH